MKRAWSIVGWSLLVLVALVAAVVAAAWSALPLEGTTVTVDGETFSLSALSGGQLVATFAIVVLATVAALVVGALATALGLTVAGIGVGVGLLAVVATLAILASPFLLVGWLVWRATRRPRAVVAAPAP